MAPTLSRPLVQAVVGEKQLEITVRNTFLHVAVSALAEADMDDEPQPGMRRAITTPVTWLSEESSEGEEGGEDDDDDGFEMLVACKLPSLRRITTQDHFDSPAMVVHPHVNQIEVQDSVDLSAPRKSPAFRHMKTYDAFESPVGLDSAIIQSFDGTACISATKEDARAAPAAPSSPSGSAPLVSKVAVGGTMAQPSVGQAVVSHSPAAQLKHLGAARGKAPSDKTSSSRTTIMLRNLPNNYTRAMLLDLIDWAGFAGKYDFLYLPIDFRTHAALGYTFINLVSPEEAERLRKFFDGFSKWALPSSKVCSATWSHPHQGYEAHVQRYRNSPLMHEAVPDAYRPILFTDGVRVPFPPPTKKIKPPRQGTERMLV
mmetsp:Transcript_100101/g.250927  ORF Transcript_100101/g.250927 Transcript_100101/m.250927 type:complete len:372 (-) Transcript_100101:261-1376(-)